MDATLPDDGSRRGDRAAGGLAIRVDAAHHAASANAGQLDSEASADSKAAAPLELIAAAAGLSTSHWPEQFELQARQLADHLLARSRDVDRREAQLNAHLAQLDSEARTARLIVQEQTQRLSEQEQQYYARLSRLAQREAELAAQAGASGTAAAAQLDERERQLAERQIRIEAQELRQRLAWQRLQAQREGSMQLVRRLMHTLERRRQALEEHEQHRLRQIDLDAARQQELLTELEERRAALLEAQQGLEHQRAALAAQQQQLAAEMQRHHEDVRRQQALWEQQKASLEAERTQQHLAASQRAQELAQRQSALEQMQSQVAATHREALELRLATEQLWSQMGGQIQPAQLAQSLTRLRAKLAEHFALAEQTLTRRKDELRELSARLDGQLQQLDAQRQELRAWAQRQEEQIERQAARLVAREQELEQQQLASQRQQQRDQQLLEEYEREIHRLKAQLRRPAVLTASAASR